MPRTAPEEGSFSDTTQDFGKSQAGIRNSMDCLSSWQGCNPIGLTASACYELYLPSLCLQTLPCLSSCPSNRLWAGFERSLATSSLTLDEAGLGRGCKRYKTSCMRITVGRCVSKTRTPPDELCTPLRVRSRSSLNSCLSAAISCLQVGLLNPAGSSVKRALRSLSCQSSVSLYSKEIGLIKG